jgi:hypothetical protein
VEPVSASIAGINAAILRRLGGPEHIPYLALPCGTAVVIDETLPALLRGEAGDGAEIDERRAFLAAHDIAGWPSTPCG